MGNRANKRDRYEADIKPRPTQVKARNQERTVQPITNLAEDQNHEKDVQQFSTALTVGRNNEKDVQQFSTVLTVCRNHERIVQQVPNLGAAFKVERSGVIGRGIFQHYMGKLAELREESNYKGLLREAIQNGFESELVGIPEKVQEKLVDTRHIAIGSPLSDAHMLAVILYTDTKELYKDMRTVHRTQGMYERKWAIFQYLLSDAVRILREKSGPNTDQILYHGLKSVSFNDWEKYKENGFGYCSFVSTSADSDVATSVGFLGEEGGLLLEIDCSVASPKESAQEGYGGHGARTDMADVSWISKYGTEKEVLISIGGLFEIIGSPVFDPIRKCYVLKCARPYDWIHVMM